MLAETTAWTTLAWLDASGLLMIWAATHLTQAAEQIATSTGIGHHRAGAMLLAAGELSGSGSRRYHCCWWGSI